MRRRGHPFTAALLVLLVACESAGNREQRGDGENRRVELDTGPLPPSVDSTTAVLSAAFRRAARRALPSVVFVQVQTMAASSTSANAAMPWPQEGTGSGFVYRPDGYILTNNHVVVDATRVTVVLQDRREFTARIVGRDPNTDVALLKIDADGLRPLEIGDSDPLDVGDWVVALGYPLHLGSTATAGIVSAKGRNLQILRGQADAPAPLEHFIQTDAAINVGNSGGPLVDLDGRVVGMNSAIASPTGFYSGYGFAIPINLVDRVARDLMSFGEVHRPRLGVAVEDVDPADAEVYGLECVCGAEVIRVTPRTPAETAGIVLGDVIVAVDGARVERSGELLERLARSEPGKTVRLDIVRFGRPARVDVKLGTFEPTVPARLEPPPPRDAGLGRLGFAATELSGNLARQLGMAEGGVIISQVDLTHPAGQSRLQPGAILEQLNGQAIGNLQDLRRVADAIRPGQAVSLIVRGRDGSRTIINYRVRG